MVDGVNQLDQISDFTRGQDKIDLSRIDADDAVAGDQVFIYLADPANDNGDWTGLAWETVNPRNGIPAITISADGDAEPEMQIYMSHAYTFTAGDFILQPAAAGAKAAVLQLCSCRAARLPHAVGGHSQVAERVARIPERQNG